jgi:hypothetical protein
VAVARSRNPHSWIALSGIVIPVKAGIHFVFSRVRSIFVFVPPASAASG